MTNFRRDEIPFIVSCVMNLLWSFSSILSVDMIKLYSYYFMHDHKYDVVYYIVFTASIFLLTFLKFNKIFTTVMVIWFNMVVHLLLVIFIFYPVKSPTFFYVLFGFWSHLYALNLISTIYLASYNRGGLYGLVIGSAFAYYFGYLLFHGVRYPSDHSVASRRLTCNWFITVRCAFSVMSFKFYRDFLEFYFYFEYEDAINGVSMRDLFQWVDGKPLPIMPSVRISDLMPCCLDFQCIRDILKETDVKNKQSNPGLEKYRSLYLFVFCMAFSTTSFFSPTVFPSPLFFSVYFKEYVYFLEFLAGFLGIIVSTVMTKYVTRFLMVLYFVHSFLAGILFMVYNSNDYTFYTISWLLSIIISIPMFKYISVFILLYFIHSILAAIFFLTYNMERITFLIITVLIVITVSISIHLLFVMNHYINEYAIFVNLVPYVLSVSLYLFYKTKMFEMCRNKYVIVGMAMVSSFIGNFILVHCFVKFFLENVILHCKVEESKPCGTCCKNDTGTCLCYNKDLGETCGEEFKEQDQCVNIWIPYNNHSTYRDWNYSDCIFCLSQNYQNIGVTCCCGAGGTCKCANKCCACCCPCCPNGTPCNCQCTTGGGCGNGCCCSSTGANKTCHYLLRNCVLSCCPYCDYCLLFECVKIPCVCPCSHKGHETQKRNISNDNNNEKKCCLTKIQLNKDLSGAKHICLCTYAKAPDVEQLKKQFCCKVNGTCSTDKCCCIRCCQKAEGTDCSSTNICGKHFDIAYHKTSACCHYDLKLWISLKELNSTFHIGQQPFKDKYSPVNSLILTNKKCRTCPAQCSCCNGNGKPVDVLRVVDSADISESGGAIQTTCSGAGSCKCCCCCCQSNCGSDCCCCCGCCQEPTCSNGKKCCAIKVVPTNLPFQFRELDIRRSEMVSLICLAVPLFCLFRFIFIFGFTFGVRKDYLNLNFTLTDFTNVHGITVTSFHLQNYRSDGTYAKQLFPDFEGSEEAIVSFAVDVEMEVLEKNIQLIKSFMDELNGLLLDLWVEDLIKNPKRVLPKSYSKLRFYKHLNSFLEFGMAHISLRIADMVYLYFARFVERWRLEWEEFQKRFVRKLKVYTDYSLSINNLGYFEANAVLQQMIDEKQLQILRMLNARNTKLTEVLETDRVLLQNLGKAPRHEKLPAQVDVWEFRYDLMKSWCEEKTLYLGWSPFMTSMQKIQEWNQLYRGIYTQAFIDRYGLENVQN